MVQLLDVYSWDNGMSGVDFVKFKRGGRIRATILSPEGETAVSFDQSTFRELVIEMYKLSNTKTWAAQSDLVPNIFTRVSDFLTKHYGFPVTMFPCLYYEGEAGSWVVFQSKYSKDCYIPASKLRNEICSSLIKFVDSPIVNGDPLNQYVRHMLTSTESIKPDNEMVEHEKTKDDKRNEGGVKIVELSEDTKGALEKLIARVESIKFSDI